MWSRKSYCQDDDVIKISIVIIARKISVRLNISLVRKGVSIIYIEEKIRY